MTENDPRRMPKAQPMSDAPADKPVVDPGDDSGTSEAHDLPPNPEPVEGPRDKKSTNGSATGAQPDNKRG